MVAWRTIRSAAWAACALAIVAMIGTGCARDVAKESSEPVTGPLAGPSGRLHVDHGGGTTGLPVVFVHSFAGSSVQWSHQIDHLRPARRVIALDLRGHGQSDPPASGSYAVDSLASDIAAVVDGHQLQRFVLVGHSMGGAAAVAYAGAHPERVAGLVLVGTPGKAAPEMAKRVLGSMEADYEAVSESYWTKLLTDALPNNETQIRSSIRKVPREAGLAIITAIFAYDPLTALHSYTGPRLLIDTPHGDGPDALHNQAPDIPRKVIMGTSHWPHMDKPEEFNRILDEFLATAT